MNDNITKAYLNIITENAARKIPDDADFEEEMRNAIDANELVSFKYMKKDGSQYTMTVLPTQMTTMAGKPAVKVYLNGVKDQSKERTLYVSSMGNAEKSDVADKGGNKNIIGKDINSDENAAKTLEDLYVGLDELLNSNPEFTKGETPYFFTGTLEENYKICRDLDVTRNVLFYKVIGYSPETGKVALECHSCTVDVKTISDGDYDDGRSHSWTIRKTVYFPTDDICGYIYGYLKDGKIFTYSGAELKKLPYKSIFINKKTKDNWGPSYRTNRRW